MIYSLPDLADFWHVTGAERPNELRVGFEVTQGYLDAPAFLPKGSTADPFAGEMLPRESWEAIEDYEGRRLSHKGW